MVEILAIMVLGILCGFLLRRKDRIVKLVEPLLTWSVYILLLFIGIGVGINKVVLDKLDVIGYQALALTIGGVLGSSVLALLCYKLFFKKNSNYER